MTQPQSPKDFEVAQLRYDLPQDRIAQYPLAERDLSKLLLYRGGQITESIYRDIHAHLPAGCLLVFNDTKVIPARLHFQTPTGATIEILCLEPVQSGLDPGTAVAQQQPATWKCMVGNAKRWKVDTLTKESPNGNLQARLIGREDKLFLVEFTWTPEEQAFGDVLQTWGEIPIPPYFDRDSEEIDRVRYQTTYAGREGSVAAPTAGLHFTERVFESLKSKSISTDFVTLHVGAGTFLPIKGDRLRDHEMHAEWIDVELRLIDRHIEQLQRGAEGGGVIAVGTTSLRTMESLYWMGVKSMHSPGASIESLEVGQWDPYELPPPPGQAALPDAVTALQALRTHAHALGHDRVVARTRLLIVPTYPVRIARAIVTNFHQPGSTLLLLIGAFLGDDWQRVYQYALDNDFRFLSYGDGGIYFLG